ncbi:leucine-rich repeat domain-containing protein [Fibrella forsythiae]|uniref:Leucine-rich repeat domain-containing protein n=1 Tax=Fibrella forsythiae TaxID=2817061 RepID=A0ABS3JP90_9BACT|nr:leucine-rich repeat domain-containing protein [Fibrella forsythiae]MBO0951821.1 leucine-rich repeat domain-containing protein [Fibrella forsythiae]
MKFIIFCIFFTGTVAFGQHSTVDTLINLQGLKLKSIPDSVFNKPATRSLNLGPGNVVFYPPLSAIADSTNELSELPEKIARLTKLRSLYLSFNQLKSLPNSIVHLNDLVILDVSFNVELDIVNELDKLKQLPHLKTLYIVGAKNVLNNLTLIKKSLKPDVKIIASFDDLLQK